MWAHIATNTIRLRGPVKLELNLTRKNRKGRNYLFILALGLFSDVIIEDCLIIEASFISLLRELGYSLLRINRSTRLLIYLHSALTLKGQACNDHLCTD